MEYTTSLRVFFYTALTATLAILARVYYYHQRIKDLPRVGTSPGLLGLRTGAARADFVKHGRKYIEEGCDMVSPRESNNVICSTKIGLPTYPKSKQHLLCKQQI